MIRDLSILESLIKASVSGDKSSARSIVERLIDDASASGDAALVQLYKQALQTAEAGYFEDKTDVHAIKAAFDIKERPLEIPIGVQQQKTNATLDKLILQAETIETIRSVIDEQHNYQDFLEAGLKPRHKILLIGPPGNGKTQATKAFAKAMNLPLYFVRYDDLLSQKAGESSKRLNAVFTFAKSHRCILFFDEIDAIGKERSDPNESAEMKRVVSTLLVQLDDVPPHVIILGATNHAGLLDRAFLRRFDIRMQLPGPETAEYEAFLRMRFKLYNHEPKTNLRVLGIAIQTENFAEAEIFVDDCIREYIKQKGRSTIEEAIENTLQKWPKARVKIPM